MPTLLISAVSRPLFKVINSTEKPRKFNERYVPRQKREIASTAHLPFFHTFTTPTLDSITNFRSNAFLNAFS
jgi:hypothetical protein